MKKVYSICLPECGLWENGGLQHWIRIWT